MFVCFKCFLQPSRARRAPQVAHSAAGAAAAAAARVAMCRKISGARRKEAPSNARTRAPKRKQRDATSKSSSQPGPADKRRRPRRAAAAAAIAAMNANTTRERRKHGSSFVEVCWWHMTFVVLPGRPPHPGIVQDDVTDVWKSSGRLWPSRRRTTGKIVGSQSGPLRAASWQQGNLRDGAEYGPTAVCRTGIYTLWTIYDCLIITSVSRECLRPIGLMGAFAGAGGRCSYLAASGGVCGVG